MSYSPQDQDQYHQNLWIEAQKMYAEITQYVQEIQENLPYLYVDTSNHSDIEFITRSIHELEQQFISQAVNMETMYHQLNHLYERAKELRNYYVSEGERQRHFNSQTIEQKFTWCDEIMTSLADKVIGRTKLQSRYDKLEQTFENFDPTDYSLKNVERVNRLSEKIEKLLQDSFGPMERHIDIQVEECGICRTLLLEQSFYKLIPCEHMYHISCFDNWLNYKPNLNIDDKWNSVPPEPQSGKQNCPLCNTWIDHYLRYEP